MVHDPRIDDAVHRLLAPISQCFTPDVARRLVEAKIDDETQARISELADKNTEGALTDQERAEYDTYVNIIDVILVLQAQAREVVEAVGGA